MYVYLATSRRKITSRPHVVSTYRHIFSYSTFLHVYQVIVGYDHESVAVSLSGRWWWPFASQKWTVLPSNELENRAKPRKKRSKRWRRISHSCIKKKRFERLKLKKTMYKFNESYQTVKPEIVYYTLSPISFYSISIVLDFISVNQHR